MDSTFGGGAFEKILFSLSYRIHILNDGYFYPQGRLQRGTKSEDLHHREPLKAHVKTHGSPHPHLTSPGPTTHCKQLASQIFY